MDTKQQVKTKGTTRLFENPILEKLTRTHIAIPISILSGTGIGIVIYGLYHQKFSIFELALWFVVGLFSFTLLEYVMHRYLYHIKPTTEKRKKLQYTLHGVHHEYPNDKERLAMPPIVSVLLATLLFLLFNFLMGRFSYAFAPGFFVGYSAYLFIHYSVHAFAPPKNFLKNLWIHHNIHHFKQSERAYGVSSPLWDHVFGTMPVRKQK